MGVKRARSNAGFTWREGFREGWAHWGVLFRTALVFLAANAGSAMLLFGRCYLIGQAFAERIAVFENRRALDAIAKARLFLHGRIGEGLKLVVASFLGVVLVVLMGLAVIAPVVLLLRASAGVWGVLPAVALVVLPTVFVALSTIGIVASSVWTIGYLEQVER